MSIGERIAEERKRLRLTQAVFAEKLGVSLSSQKRYEINNRAPNVHYIGAIAEIGVDVAYVMTGSHDPRKRLSFAVAFDRLAAETLALAALDLDTESFADAVSTIQCDSKEYFSAVLDALIKNSSPLQDRLGVLKRKNAPAKKRVVK